MLPGVHQSRSFGVVVHSCINYRYTFAWGRVGLKSFSTYGSLQTKINEAKWLSCKSSIWTLPMRIHRKGRNRVCRHYYLSSLLSDLFRSPTERKAAKEVWVALSTETWLCWPRKSMVTSRTNMPEIIVSKPFTNWGTLIQIQRAVFLFKDKNYATFFLPPRHYCIPYGEIFS